MAPPTHCRDQWRSSLSECPCSSCPARWCSETASLQIKCVIFYWICLKSSGWEWASIRRDTGTVTICLRFFPRHLVKSWDIFKIITRSPTSPIVLSDNIKPTFWPSMRLTLTHLLWSHSTRSHRGWCLSQARRGPETPAQSDSPPPRSWKPSAMRKLYLNRHNVDRQLYSCFWFFEEKTIFTAILADLQLLGRKYSYVLLSSPVPKP